MAKRNVAWTRTAELQFIGILRLPQLLGQPTRPEEIIKDTTT